MMIGRGSVCQRHARAGVGQCLSSAEEPPAAACGGLVGFVFVEHVDTVWRLRRKVKVVQHGSSRSSAMQHRRAENMQQHSKHKLSELRAPTLLGNAMEQSLAKIFVRRAEASIPVLIREDASLWEGVSAKIATQAIEEAKVIFLLGKVIAVQGHFFIGQGHFLIGQGRAISEIVS